MRLIRKLRVWLADPFRRKRYVVIPGPSTEMNWLTGKGTVTYPDGRVEHFDAGPNPIDMPDWLVNAVNKAERK